MNVKQLTEQIISDAREKARGISEEGHLETDKLEDETMKILQEKRTAMYEKVNRKETELKQSSLAKRERKNTLAILSCKQQLLEQTFNIAKTKLKTMGASQRKELLDILWNKAQEQMEVARVAVAKQDSKYFKDVEVESINSIGGFISYSSDGKESLDMRFETLLEVVREKKTHEIAEVLFK